MALIPTTEHAMSFALYMLGFVIFLGGLIWGAVEVGIGDRGECQAR